MVVEDEAMGEDGAEGREGGGAWGRRRGGGDMGEEGGLEPATVLVGTFEVEVCEGLTFASEGGGLVAEGQTQWEGE